MKVLVLYNIPEETRKQFAALKGYEFIYASRDDDFSAYQDAEIVIGNPPLDKISQLPSLRWLQLTSAGANQYAGVADPVILTNAAGAHAVAISEHMLAAILMVQKKLDRYMRLQKEHDYRRLEAVRTMNTCTALCIGMGNIGSALAQRLKALGAKVIGVRRSVHDKPDFVDELYAYDDIDSLLPQADIIALSLPETRETIGLFNEDRLRLCKQDSILVNVGRGSAIVSADLIKVVKENRFLGVCLDVQHQEPLPKDDPLWDTEGIYLTPHVSAGNGTEVTVSTLMSIILENLNRYAANKPLINVVDKSIGY